MGLQHRPTRGASEGAEDAELPRLGTKAFWLQNDQAHSTWPVTFAKVERFTAAFEQPAR
jgi:hypothetical protein